MTSPSFSSRSPIRKVRESREIETCEAPETQGRPIPRATTAAWLVIPPRAVRMPVAACMPWMSSGLVSTRTRMTFSPRCDQLSAVSASSTILPEAAPGEAGRPVVMTSRCASGSSVGWSNWSSAIGSTRRIAWRWSISPSPTISTAILSADLAVRLPLRVWSSHSLPCWTVNSISCMSA